jgi:hypothetical protein
MNKIKIASFFLFFLEVMSFWAFFGHSNIGTFEEPTDK